jgi:hypothetical protein
MGKTEIGSALIPFASCPNPLHTMWRRAGALSIPSSRAGFLRHFAGIALTNIIQTEVVTSA